MKWLLLRNSLLFAVIAITLAACASDRRVDYDNYPEFEEAKAEFGETYLSTVKSQSDFYQNDDEFHGALREQIEALYSLRILVNDTVKHIYDQLTRASSQEVFQNEFAKMNQRILAIQEGDLPPDTLRPLIDWVALLGRMRAELELRNQRVKEMRAKKEMMKLDSTMTDTIPGGFSVMPIN